ncbi:MAG: 3-methylornithyl-N6-L-lysine dehydrogenase PylD [Candidatus Methanoplasma sp.]|jgi:pyrrolysine biosynthesis protein PylD|nr:3-methylornithyl-N6-L-lysine dehydrogenase PylD [Candidatus Methanoplasma sp.]
MTRLTDDMVKGIIDSLDGTNDMLITSTGMDTLELACEAIGLTPEMLDLENIKVGVVPITSGKGIIKKFSESVAEIARKLGMEAFVTENADVTGIAEALSAEAEIIFMADDIKFIALNTTNGKFSHNSFSTAAGYVTALKGAAGGLAGKEVLILGAGRVGSIAAEMMAGMGSYVTVYDIDAEKMKRLSDSTGVKMTADINGALSSHDFILNASPGAIDGRYLKEGAIVSSPGIPFAFDELGMKKAKMIIHDPLDIGAAVMAVEAASFSRLKKP